MKRLIYFLSFIIFLFYICLINPLPSDAAKIDPSFRFYTIETKHFVIHFHQGLDEIANRAASISEEIYTELTSEFQWLPKEKTQIVLLDNIDFANGAATVIPYNAIYIFVVPPLPDTVIGEYDDWLRLVLLHEYTHVLTMDPARGYSTITRKIFGKTLPGYDPLSLLFFLTTAPPNIFMPDWWLEGIATWAETEYTTAGRGRSSFVEMILRMAVLEDAIPRVDQLNGDVPYWPSRRIPYLYGMLLNKYITETYGKNIPGQLNILQAGRFPFFINTPPKQLTGLNYVELYREMVSKLRSDQYEKIRQLNTRKLTEYNKIPIRGELLTNPRVSPNGRYIAVNRRDPRQHEKIVVVDTETFEEIASIKRFPSDHNISWAPDSQKLYYAQADAKGSYNLYQDIFLYDFSTASVRRLTKELRAKDIDVSPDGTYIVFIKIETGRQNIATLKMKDNSIKIITDFKDSALSGPRWSPDGQFIVFSRHDNSGGTSIELLNFESGTIETLLKDEHYNINPTWSPDGNMIIFSSDRTGVYNLFAYSLTDQKIYQITHVLGGAFQPEISKANNRIFFSGYNSKGFFIAEMPYDPMEWSEELSPKINLFWDNITSSETPENIHSEREATSVEVTEKKKYYPVQTLKPKFWLPSLLFDHDGPVFGAFTAGQDVLGYHTYLLQGGYGISNEAYYDFTYIYDRWEPTFFFRAYSLPFAYSEFFEDGEDYYERQRGLVTGVKIPLPLSTLESRYNILAGYHLLKVGQLTDIDNRTIDGLEVYEGRRDNLFVGFNYRGALKYPYSISREEGRNITLLYRNYLKGLDQKEYSLDYEEFIGMGKNRVIYFNLKGATSEGEAIAQQAYKIGGPPSTVNAYSLRGFSSGFQTGKHILTGTVEYRFPVKYILRGWNTKPFFWDRFHIAAFTDIGNVWGFNKGFRLSDFSVGIGAEARLDVVLGYKIKITPAVGIAQGLTDDGETQIYITIYVGL
jgi:Tol biopolymer transport system component